MNRLLISNIEDIIVNNTTFAYQFGPIAIATVYPQGVRALRCLVASICQGEKKKKNMEAFMDHQFIEEWCFFCKKRTMAIRHLFKNCTALTFFPPMVCTYLNLCINSFFPEDLTCH